MRLFGVLIVGLMAGFVLACSRRRLPVVNLPSVWIEPLTDCDWTMTVYPNTDTWYVLEENASTS